MPWRGEMVHVASTSHQVVTAQARPHFRAPVRINPELVVAAPNILPRRVTAHDHSRRVVTLEPAHRAEPGFEPAVVSFDPVVRVLGGVVERGRHEHPTEKRERGDVTGLERRSALPRIRRPHATHPKTATSSPPTPPCNAPRRSPPSLHQNRTGLRPADATTEQKDRAAKIANSPGASSRGGRKSGSGGNAKQGGTTAQHKAAGRKGGKATAKKS